MRAAAPLILAALVVVQAGAFIANSSATYDETVYLRMAEGAYQRRDNAEFAVKGVAPLPVMLLYALPAVNFVPEYAQAILMARMSAVALVAVPLALIVYFWLAAEVGPRAAAAGATLVALSPNIVAHGSIATTDGCFVVSALLTLWALARYVERPTGLRGAVLIAAGAVVFAAKFSGAALFAVAAAVLLWKDRPERRVWARLASAAALSAAMLGAGLVVTANYHPIAGLLSQMNHQRLGHEAYLLGRLSTTGWWYYQPIALALKSTYVELAAFAVAAVAFTTLRREPSIAVRVWAVAAAAILALSMTSRVSIGVRYVLLVVPLAIMAATVWVARLAARRAGLAAIVAVSALAVQAAAAVTAAPRPLSYFNGLAGGPMNGYRLLADSNLDWGQDLPAMRQVLASVGAREPVAAYFGSAPPDAYGANVWMWNVAGPDVKARADWIVISATYLVGLYQVNDPFEPFRRIEPSARPTPTLFVYEGARPDVKAALAQTLAR